MQPLGEAPHGGRVNRWKDCVYEQYTWQDNPMENAEKILQYYKQERKMNLNR